MRWWVIAWMCAGALGLGIVISHANKRQTYVSRWWYLASVLLGPIFLAFVVPLWLGKWGEGGKR